MGNSKEEGSSAKRKKENADTMKKSSIKEDGKGIVAAGIEKSTWYTKEEQVIINDFL